MSSDLAYLSIIEWPEGLDEPGRVQGLIRGAGIDAHAARMAVRRGTPQVIGRMNALAAQRAADNLHAIGATAFAPRSAEMAAAPEPFQAKRLIPAEGSPEAMYACEAWRGEGRSIRMSDVFLIVRATLATSETRTTIDRPLNMASPSMLSGMGALTIAGAFGNAGATAGRSIQISTSDMLDLWLRDGSRIRIDGRKFSFDILGDGRGLTERDNIDLLVARLSQEAPAPFWIAGSPTSVARQMWSARISSTQERALSAGRRMLPHLSSIPPGPPSCTARCCPAPELGAYDRSPRPPSGSSHRKRALHK